MEIVTASKNASYDNYTMGLDSCVCSKNSPSTCMDQPKEKQSPDLNDIQKKFNISLELLCFKVYLVISQTPYRPEVFI